MHSRTFISLPCLVLMLGVSCLLLSCGGPSEVQGHGTRKELNKVTGTVTVNGQPMAGIKVNAMPIGGDADNPHAGQALTDENGNYIFSTYATNDGLPAGEHVLTYSLPTFNAMRATLEGDKLGGKYSDIEKNKQDSKFKIVVTAGQEMVIPPIDLEMAEGAETKSGVIGGGDN